jgi:hypothetical protein
VYCYLWAASLLDEANELAEQGRYKEALEKHIWYHKNALKYDRFANDVRLTFALGDWVNLGEKYPPAREALVSIRDADTERFRKSMSRGKPDLKLYEDIYSINDALGEAKETLTLLTELYESDAQTAAKCWGRAYRYVVIGPIVDQEVKRKYEQWATERDGVGSGFALNR